MLLNFFVDVFDISREKESLKAIKMTFVILIYMRGWDMNYLISLIVYLNCLKLIVVFFPLLSSNSKLSAAFFKVE